MRIRSFIIAYALVLAILLFADRRPGPKQPDRYSHVVDLTDGQTAAAPHGHGHGVENPHHCSRCADSRDLDRGPDSAGAPDRSAGRDGFEPSTRRAARRFLSTISPLGNRSTARFRRGRSSLSAAPMRTALWQRMICQRLGHPARRFPSLATRLCSSSTLATRSALPLLSRRLWT